MKSAYFTTILMGVIATVAAAFAAASYPWPEAVTQNAQISKPLFESYETSSVRGVEVVAYNSQRSEIERFRIKRNGQNWIVPQKNGYDVTGSQLVLQVTRALNDRTVLEVHSDSQNDHVKFGVVDPAEVGGTTARSRLGTRLVLTDRAKKTIAHIIIGDQAKNSPGKYHVRIPGKPSIYTIEFDKRMLTTQFAQWLDPNLLKLPVGNSGLDIKSFSLNRHQVDAKSKQDQKIYEVDLAINDGKLEVERLVVDSKEVDVEKLPNKFTETAVGSLFSLRPTNVVLQSKATIEFLQQSDSKDAKVIAQLADRGFLHKGFENESHQFTGTNGEISILRSDGVRLSLAIGELANRIGGDSLSLLYQAIVSAEIDPNAFPEIAKTESTEQDDRKAYLRKVKDREERMAAAQQQVRQLNKTHRDWIYVLDESVINGLFPKIEL